MQVCNSEVSNECYVYVLKQDQIQKHVNTADLPHQWVGHPQISATAWKRMW